MCYVGNALFYILTFDLVGRLYYFGFYEYGLMYARELANEVTCFVTLWVLAFVLLGLR